MGTYKETIDCPATYKVPDGVSRCAEQQSLLVHGGTMDNVVSLYVYSHRIDPGQGWWLLEAEDEA